MAEERDGVLGSNVPIIISTLVIVITIVGGFWSVVNPRDELKSIRDNYLTIREHEEFVQRFNKDIERLEATDRIHYSQFDTRLNHLQSEIDMLQRDKVDAQRR